jgi:hypothetical protein
VTVIAADELRQVFRFVLDYGWAGLGAACGPLVLAVLWRRTTGLGIVAEMLVDLAVAMLWKLATVNDLLPPCSGCHRQPPAGLRGFDGGRGAGECLQRAKARIKSWEVIDVYQQEGYPQGLLPTAGQDVNVRQTSKRTF